MQYEGILEALYGKQSSEIQRQVERYRFIKQRFEQKFKEQPDFWFSTPGRTEIGGNHTDHNHGKVLAASVNLDAVAAVKPVENGSITVFSRGYDEPFIVQLNDLHKQEEDKGTTTALIKGIAAQLKALGFKVGGFQAYIDSEVLPGSGLSSSATIEVLIGTIFNHLFNDGKIPLQQIAQIGQFAENEYFGKPCGLMDQMACAIGGILSIDFKNPTDPEFSKIDFDFEKEGYRLVVVNTGGSHADLTKDYAAIPNEMRQVARYFGKNVLREVQAEAFYQALKSLRASVSDRAILRAFHFFNENQRVTEQVKALKEKNFPKFLRLIHASGQSSIKWLQNIFTPQAPEQQSLTLALALSEHFIDTIGKGACRVHGGGFAGTIQVFLPENEIEAYSNLVSPVFGHQAITVLQIRSQGTIKLHNVFKEV